MSMASTGLRRLLSTSAGPRRLLSTAPAANPMFSLAGRTAIVTGGARDIGAACALQLARSGADVVVNYAHSAAAADETVAQIRGMGRSALAVRADVFTPDGIAALVSAAEGFFDGGVVDILVNNAGGLNVRGELCDEHMTAEVILENMHMNFVATALMSVSIFPHPRHSPDPE